MRTFEKIRFKQFKKNVCNDKKFYDFFSVLKFPLKHGEIMKIPTVVKFTTEIEEMPMLLSWSSRMKK